MGTVAGRVQHYPWHENTLHTAARKTGNLVGLTQHTPHARLPGTCPATQESEATVWTSEHRHESAGDGWKGFTADSASYQILAELRRSATSNRRSKGALQGSP